MKIVSVAVLLFLGSSVARAAMLTVGPTGQYHTVCSAVYASHNGDTILVDANHRAPYDLPSDPKHTDGRVDCVVNQSSLTIQGVNGRAILDASPIPYKGGFTYVRKGIFVLKGHGITIDHLELRNANQRNNPHTADNAAGILVVAGPPSKPEGGDITVTRCYIHDNGDGLMSSNTGPGLRKWYSPHPFIRLDHDNFYRNGDGTGQTHNIYIGFDRYGTLHFTLEHSRSKDAYVGHDVKSRAPYSDILYNQIIDTQGFTNYLLDFPLGGTVYVVGNLIYSRPVKKPSPYRVLLNYNNLLVMYRDVEDNRKEDPVYGPPHEDLHFLRNVVIDDNTYKSDAFITVGCRELSSESCPNPNSGPRLTTPAEVAGNFFIGLPARAVNQPSAKLKDNVVLPYSALTALGLRRR